ncbi:MAG TPA: vWA domain-containing protein [Polyangiaceae bacterium]|nr:vWA domain-containing protein [Polyangiaceae bacterium]
MLRNLRDVRRVAALALLGVLAGCSSNGEVTRSSSIKPSAKDGGEGGTSTNAGEQIDSGASGAGIVLHVDGSVGTGFGAGPSVDGAAPNGNTCAAATAEVKPVPLDIALLVDNSYSMDFDLRWEYVKGGLISFVSSPGQGSLGLSLQFFPLRDQCDVDTYAAPALAMAQVSDSEPDIEATLNARRMSGGTPIVQALQGVGAYATDWAKAHDDHRTVIVIATDGVPDDTCAVNSLNPPNSLDNAAKIAQSLATGTPPLPVFVIGVGEELDALNTIAAAGGTGSAVLIADGASAQEQLVDALRNIQKKSLGCEYVVPKDTAMRIDYDTVNVDFTEGGTTTSFYYAADPKDCSLKPDTTWYYDDPKTPTKIVLCPDTCTEVGKAKTARIDIAYGCKQREVR